MKKINIKKNNEKQIKEYNDNSWGNNYNNLIMGQYNHKEKYNV